jgi:hypothetical protein
MARSEATKQSSFRFAESRDGLLRCARNDGRKPQLALARIKRVAQAVADQVE